MRTVLLALLGFVLGAVGSVFLLFFGYIVFTLVTDYHDFEGATAMGLFSMSPVIALIGAIAGAIVLPQITRRKPS